MDLKRGTDAQFEGLLRRFSEELIQYTPEHFKQLYCALRKGKRDGQDALFYEIGAPAYPEQSTTQPSPELHEVACALVRYWEGGGTTFPGLRLTARLDDDGQWTNTLDVLDEAGPSKTS